MCGEFNADGSFFFGQVQDVDDQPFFQEFFAFNEVVAHDVFFVGFFVQEVVADVVLVEELCGTSFYTDLLDFGARWKIVFNDGACGEVFEFGSDECLSFPGFDMLEFNDAIEGVAEDQHHARVDVVRGGHVEFRIFAGSRGGLLCVQVLFRKYPLGSMYRTRAKRILRKSAFSCWTRRKVGFTVWAFLRVCCRGLYVVCCRFG